MLFDAFTISMATATYRDKKDMFDLAEMIVKELNQKHAKMFSDYALQNCDYVKTSDLKLGDKNRFTMENI